MLPTKPDLTIVSGFFARPVAAMSSDRPKNIRRARETTPAPRTFWRGPKIAAGGSSIVAREDGSDKCAKVVTIDHCATTIGEVAFLTACDHPNIIRCIGVEYSSEYMCMQLEYFEITLAAYCGCRAHGRKHPCGCPPICDAVGRGSLARGIASGLAYIHARGIIHADLKPENIFVRVSAGAVGAGVVSLLDPVPGAVDPVPDAADPVPGAANPTIDAVIADFGAALLVSSPATKCDLQTPLYRAPEVVPGVIPCVLMDMWSFGVILLELDGFQHNITEGRRLVDFRADVTAAAALSTCPVVAGCIRDVATRMDSARAAALLGASVTSTTVPIGDVGMAIRANLPSALSTRLALAGTLDDAVNSLTACLVGRACDLSAKNVRDAMMLSESTAGVVLRPRRRG